MPTVTSKNREEFIEAELAKKSGKKPKKMPHEMTASQLEKHRERARAIGSHLTKQLIDAGLGHLRHSDMMESKDDHPLIKTYKEHSPYQESLEQEIKNREAQKYGQRKNYTI
jgi:hypothetical protein